MFNFGVTIGARKEMANLSIKTMPQVIKKIAMSRYSYPRFVPVIKTIPHFPIYGRFALTMPCLAMVRQCRLIFRFFRAKIKNILAADSLSKEAPAGS
jgi:hypothetical protein